MWHFLRYVQLFSERVAEVLALLRSPLNQSGPVLAEIKGGVRHMPYQGVVLTNWPVIHG
jgi:hypothetical protein